MSITTTDNALNWYYDLDKIARACRVDCVNKQFLETFTFGVSHGVWVFRPTKCPDDCSGRGVCDVGQCACKPGWGGQDCNRQLCPGSICSTHPTSREPVCTSCSQRGRCVSGKCLCDVGWSGQDCGIASCPRNCSSTPDVLRGVCELEFPVAQCICVINSTHHFYGDDCGSLKCTIFTT